MSTPPVTETFVTGDRVTYTYQGKSYTGTIIEPYSSYSLEGWYKIDLSDRGYGICILPGSRMKKIEPPRVEESSLDGLKVKLQGQINDWVASRTSTDDIGYAFDAGYLSGLRRAINILDELADKPESL